MRLTAYVQRTVAGAIIIYTVAVLPLIIITIPRPAFDRGRNRTTANVFRPLSFHMRIVAISYLKFR
jgi:hypothetical protein